MFAFVNELTMVEERLSEQLLEAQRSFVEREEASDESEESDREARSPKTMSLMQAELRAANKRMLAEVVAGHMASAAKRKAALEKVMSSRNALVMNQVDQEHRASAAKRRQALDKVLAIKHQRLLQSEGEVGTSTSTVDASVEILKEPSSVPSRVREKQEVHEERRTREKVCCFPSSLFQPESRGERIRIERRESRKLPFSVSRGDKIRWQFTVSRYNVSFSVLKREMSDGGAIEVEVVKKSTVDSTREHRGEWTATGPTTLILVFDNTFSLMRAKDVLCSVDIDRAGERSWQEKYHREWRDLHNTNPKD